MRIAFISGSECSGGASRAAIRLIDPWAAMPLVQARHFTGKCDRVDGGAYAMAQPGVGRQILTLLMGTSHPLSKKLHRRACLKNLLRLLEEFQPTLINLHNVNPWYGLGFSRDFVVKLAQIAPVIWTLHDDWALNGQRCYPGDPDAPDAESNPEIINERIRALGPRLTWVSPSHWLADRARMAFPQMRVEVVPYGVDLETFRPLPRDAARISLGLDPQKRTLLVVGDQIHIARKGLKLLAEACVDVALPFEMIVVGTGTRLPEHFFPVRTRQIRAVEDDRLLRQYYAAADAVVIPSLEDNLPCVLLEALACGVPVVGLSTGGIPDLLKTGENGWLVPQGNLLALTGALAKAVSLTEEEADDLKQSCRAFAEKHLAPQLQVRRYQEIAREMLA